jgi:hypothetical protein
VYLCLLNSTSRACTSAGTAIDAGISVDLVLAISLSDSSYRALASAGAAAYACIVNYICHDIVPPLFLTFGYILYYNRKIFKMKMLYFMFKNKSTGEKR